MNKIEKVQVIDYKVAKIKAIEVVSAKERYKVKDFWATLNNRIKKIYPLKNLTNVSRAMRNPNHKDY
jgi:hypothetical protein